MGFRPLDGESFSKRKDDNDGRIHLSFRPLDGESFSKHRGGQDDWDSHTVSVP